jgi:hypothetical protein
LRYELPLWKSCPHITVHPTAAASTIGEALVACLEIVFTHSFAAEQEYQEEMAALDHSRMTLFSSLEFYLEKECCWMMQWSM